MQVKFTPLPEETANQIIKIASDLQTLLKHMGKSTNYMTIQEAADYIRRSKAYVQRRKELIGYYKEGKDLTFKKADIDAYMDSLYFRPSSPAAYRS